MEEGEETDNLMFHVLPENILLRPRQATLGSVGYDLFITANASIKAHSVTTIDTQVTVKLPTGYCGQIVARSSAGKKGLVIQGTIDEDYRGTLNIIVHNNTDTVFVLSRGESIAQLLVLKRYMGSVHITTDLNALGKTQRGEKGFGSTGHAIKEGNE